MNHMQIARQYFIKVQDINIFRERWMVMKNIFHIS